MDLQRVLEDEEIRVSVPFHFLGEKTAPGVKAGGVVSRVMNELEITCLPKHLPEFIEVDLSDLELEGVRSLGDVVLPEGVSISGGEEMLEQPVVIIHRPRREEEEETEGEATGEGEVPKVGEEAGPEED